MTTLTDESMRIMAKMAIDSATTHFAEMADEFADTLDPSVTGVVALRAFAEAIRQTNKKLYPPGSRS